MSQPHRFCRFCGFFNISISDFLFLYCIMSFNAFWKAREFLDINFGPGIFWFLLGALGILMGSDFCPHSPIRSSLGLSLESEVPPLPLLGRAVGQKQKHFPPLRTEIFVCTQCTSSANFFCRFVHKHGCLVKQFIFFFFQVCFLRALQTVYRRQ